MKPDRMDKLLQFVERLEKARIPFRLSRNRYDAISVEVMAPGERWEVDFSEDGTIDVERFRSDGEIFDESAFKELFALWAEDPAEEAKKAASEPVKPASRKRRAVG